MTNENNLRKEVINKFNIELQTLLREGRITKAIMFANRSLRELATEKDKQIAELKAENEELKEQFINNNGLHNYIFGILCGGLGVTIIYYAENIWGYLTPLILWEIYPVYKLIVYFKKKGA